MLLAVECFKCGFKAGGSAGSAVTIGSAREELSVFALTPLARSHRMLQLGVVPFFALSPTGTM